MQISRHGVDDRDQANPDGFATTVGNRSPPVLTQRQPRFDDLAPLASWVKRSSPSEMPFIVLPRTIPSSGIAYCGACRMDSIARRRSITVTAKEETNIDRVPTPNPQ